MGAKEEDGNEKKEKRGHNDISSFYFIGGFCVKHASQALRRRSVMIQIINVIGKQGYHKIMNENFYIYSLLPAKSISRILVLPLHLTTATTT